MGNEALIQKVSILYREHRKIATDINTKIESIKIKLLDETISHMDWVKFQDKLIYLEKRYLEETAFANGIAAAREELF